MPRVNISSDSPYEAMHGYSRAVRVRGHVHVAGTLPAEAVLAAGAGSGAQAASALANVCAALADVGAGPADVVRTVLYVTDIGDMREVSAAHREVFGAVRPASTMVEVARLVDPRMRVEIEAYAIVDEEGGEAKGGEGVASVK